MKYAGENSSEYVAVKAWDVPTRILHWLNALTILSLALLALTMWMIDSIKIPDDDIKAMLIELVKRVHVYAGYSLAVTFTLRVIWGFAGNRYARFSDLISFRKEHWNSIAGNIKWYLSGFKGSPPISIGHNPLASLIYIPLFFVLAAQVLTGVVLAGIVFDLFPGPSLAAWLGEEGLDALEMKMDELHIYGFYFIAFFFCAHMGGLIVHELGEKCGLLSSMIHGRKYFKKEELEEALLATDEHGQAHE